MFTIAAINVTDSERQWEPEAPTKEAQEFSLTQKYHEGLLKMQAKEYIKACELLEDVLKDPLISKTQVDNTGSDHHLRQLRYLSLKNLGTAFQQQGSDYYERALHCYLQAVELDANDSVLWNQLGTLSCSMGLLSTARWAFEQGLLCSPNNWNIMEKLLEVIIAIGDEVACLSVANLILKQWPAHSRALHVKNIIDDPEKVPFAPRGIGRLEPKHVSLKFSYKRKSTDDGINSAHKRKKSKETAQLQLRGATWSALVDGVLHLLTGTSKNMDESDELMNGNAFGSDKTTGNHLNYCAYAHRVDICFSTDTDSSDDSAEKKESTACTVGADNSSCDPFKAVDKENTADRDNCSERRSSRLESLRSRKSGKDESESNKDIESVVVKYLDSFIIGRFSTQNSACTLVSDCSGSEVLNYSYANESDDVTMFLSEVTENFGPCHIAYLLLEEFSKCNIPYEDYFVKFIELAKYARQWGEDRSSFCSLFLAELLYDQALCLTDKSKCSDLFAESSYHLCKVVESVVLQASHAYELVNTDGDPDIGVEMIAEKTEWPSDLTMEKKANILNNPHNANDADIEDLPLGKGSVRTSSCRSTDFWVRYHWLSGCLSRIFDCKEKAYNEFNMSLSLLQSRKRTTKNSVGVLLPHLKSVRSITEDRILREINFIKLDSLLSENDEFMKSVTHTECMNLLPPLLLSTKDVYPDTASYIARKCEKLLLLELSALDVLISACEKTEPFNTQVYLESYRRKLQILVAAAGMVCPGTFQKDNNARTTAGLFSHMSSEDPLNSNWMQMVGETVKDISRNASKTKSCIDQLESFDHVERINLYVNVISDIQSLLLTVICGTIKVILARKAASSGLLNQSDQVECCCLVDSAIAFCKLQQMHPGVPDKTQVELMVAVHELLAEYGLCCAGQDNQGEEGTFLKFAIKHLLVLNMKLKSISNKSSAEEETCQRNESAELRNLEESSEHKDAEKFQEEEDELDEIQSSIDSALDQNFFCLYGLKINPDSLSEDDVVVHKNSNRGDYQTKEQCADVFQHLLPYAHSQSRTGLVKLRRVFRAIRKHFPQPPKELLHNNAVDHFLDGPATCETTLGHIFDNNKAPESILGVLFLGDRGYDIYKGLAARSSEPYVEVYSNLYYLITQAEETSATDKHTGFVLKKEGEEFVEQSANLLKYDLIYNPLRFESWQKLAYVYDEEVDLLLNDGSKHINILDWKKSSILHSRIEIGRRRSLRCLLVSLILASSPDQQSQMSELLALVYYDSLQNVVPFYDQRTTMPAKDANWMRSSEISMKHFEKAFSLKSEWLHAFYLGKLCEKLGRAPNEAFMYYSKAVELNPTAVDPVYRMHASRLKVLYKRGKQDLNALKIVSAYAFNEATKENAQKMLRGMPVDVRSSSDITEKCNDKAVNEGNYFDPDVLEKVWHLLYDDCLAALRICTQGELKHFHRARYRLAQGFFHRCEEGDIEKAKEELSFCFKSSRSAFTVNMWEIDGMVRKGRRKNPNISASRKNLEVSLSESSRKFITCIRKYLLFYFVLLEKTADLSTLERAYTYLKTDKRFALCLSDIVPVGLGKYVQVLASAIRNPEINSCGISLEQLLEKIFSVFMDHSNFWSDLSSIPEVNSSDVSESSLLGFVHQYIHLLEGDGRLEMLEGLNEKIRKRFKTPKLLNSNFSSICKHASIAWCRCILIKLAAITPLPSDGNASDQPSTSGGSLQLYVDLQPDELLISSPEAQTQFKGLDMNWFESLNQIKNIQIKQAYEENLESAVNLLKCCFNLYRESSCGAFPSGINLYTVLPSSPVLQPPQNVVDNLDLSVPRKLLLWAFTLVQGRYMNISAVVKYCEEMKSRSKRGSSVAAAPSESPMDCTNTPASCSRERNIDQGECRDSEAPSVPVLHCRDSIDGANVSSSSSQTVSMPEAPQLGRCSSLKAVEDAQGSITPTKQIVPAIASDNMQETCEGNSGTN